MTAGFYEVPGTMFKVPKIQIPTIQDLFDGRKPQIPLVDTSSFKKAARDTNPSKQSDLFS